jgi:N-acetyl-anhydromuramyl-L-alanine amidase AmpD
MVSKSVQITTSIVLLVIAIAITTLNVIILVKIDKSSQGELSRIKCDNDDDTDSARITSSYRLIDWRNRTTYYNHRIRIIVLHHTVTLSEYETLDVLNRRQVSVQYIVSRNGTIYYLVYRYYAIIIQF